MNSLMWWLIFFATSILLELSSPGYFFFLSFSLGALAAAFCAWMGWGTTVEFFIFLVTSTIAFFFIRRTLKGLMSDGLHRTNVYALQGKKGIVVEPITDLEKGWVKIEGELWSALAVGDSYIEKNSLVEVVGMAGSHVRVKKV